VACVPFTTAHDGTFARVAGMIELPNKAMQLTRGGWVRMEASSSAGAIVNQGEVVRPSQLIAGVRRTL
jgi:hypothetical protein